MSNLKELVLKNQEKFIKTSETYKIFTKDLLNFLGEDLFTAPASNLKSMYNAFPGGLVDHLLKVSKYAIKINETLPDSLKVEKESILKVCFLHQIGKTFLYTPCLSEWHRNNQGKLYEYNEDLVSMRISERSAYYCLKFGINLSEEEYQAIINYDKTDDDKQSKWYGSVLSTILRHANELSIIESKNTNHE
jgi:hypothetical protein